ncbi:multidrug effflux MFS transporter [Acetobacteraceae bacterium]|nr:multidrug effflux MFS transporter [Acetobacteraceae bacterium]
MQKMHQKESRQLSTIFFVLLMGSFVAIAPVSTDIYLPALPAMETDLHAAAGSGALTLSAWVLGVAIGQLLAGPLMDRFGRRMPLLVGTLIYALASIGCALSPSMPFLYFFRLIAAFFAAFSLVAPQACIRDVAKGNDGARLLSRLALVQGIVPLLAPAIGGMILEYMSWRVLFWAMAFYGFFSATLVYWVPKNTSKNHLDFETKKENIFISFFRMYCNVCRDRFFRYYGMIWVLQGIFIFSYLSAAPSIFEKSFGLTPTQYGILFGATAFMMILMTQVNAVLLKKFRTEFLLRASGFIGLFLACVFLITSFLSSDTLLHGAMADRQIWFLPVAGTLLFLLCAFVMLGPNACACALYSQGKTAGTAASLAGSGLYLIGFLSSLLMGFAPQGTSVPLAIIFLFAMGLQLAFALKAPSLPQEEHKEAL